jgi:hypothetical protein
MRGRCCFRIEKSAEQDFSLKEEMRHLRFLIAFIFCVAIFSVACVKEGPTVSSSSESTKYFTDKLQGSWIPSCENLTSLGDANILGQMRAYDFVGSQVTFTYRYFSETTCTNMVAKYYAVYNYQTIEPLQPSGYKIDLTLVDDFIITYNAAVTADYNSRGVCGLYTGWFAFNPRGITGTGCDTTLGNFVPPKSQGSKIYAIFGVDTSASPLKLMLGDATTGNGSSDLSRPTAFSTSYYTKE